MDVLRTVILIAAVLGVFGGGYFLMARLNTFLAENRRAIEKESEKKEPSCVMLTEALSDAEIAEEIRRFRSKHKGMRIVLYDSSDAELPESPVSHTLPRR